MDIRLDIGGGVCVALALFCLVLPLDWLLAALIAACIHESGHLLAVILLGGRVRRITVGSAGAVMESSPLDFPGELLAILAGPWASLCLLLLLRWTPKTALCGFVQGVFNLLPLYPLDGGRALRCLFPGKRGERICAAVESAALLLILTAGLWASFGLELGIAPILLSIFLLSRAGIAKKSCKEGILRVQ